MRIISGTYKSRRIHPPKGLPVRPTTDFAKSALFNILEHSLSWEEHTALDLFSGTGSIAWEFVSRGVPKVTAVDKDVRCIKFIYDTARQLNDQVLSTQVADYKSFLQKNNVAYSLIFADPPYALAEIANIPDLILSSDSAASNALIILEHPASVSFNNHACFQDNRNYGSVNFSFFKKP